MTDSTRLFGPSTYSALVFVDAGCDGANGDLPPSCPAANGAGAAANGGAAAANGCPVAHNSSPATPPRGFHLKLPRQADLPAVVGAVIAATKGAVGGDARIFVEGTREELRPGATPKQLAAAAAANGLIVLIATCGGAGLSAAAAARPPLQPVPAGPRPLPVVKNAPLLLRGRGDSPPERLAFNLFSNGEVEAGKDTVAIELPIRGSALDALLAEGALDEASVGARVVVTCDPAVVDELCARQHDAFAKEWNRPMQKAVQDFTGDGLFTSSTRSENWQTGHGLIPRAFNSLRIKAMYPSVLDAARDLAREMARAVPPTEPLPGFDAWLTSMTADAVVKVSLGLDMKNVRRLAAGEPVHELLSAFAFGLKHAFGRTTAADLTREERGSRFTSVKSALAAKYARCKAVCEKNVADLVEATRAGELSGVNGEPTLLASLLNDISPATGKRCRLDALYGHAINLMIAGHETTAATLGFTLAHLSQSPEWEARCVDEIRAVLGGRAEPTYADLANLPTLEACFKESLRLHPPVGSVARDAQVDTSLAGKWLVRRGQTVQVNIYGLHRRADVWGGAFGDVLAWNPARFMPGAADGRPAYAFLPFGFGVRACAGQLFALMEAKTVLCVLLNAFVLRTKPGHVIRATTDPGGAAPVPADLDLYIQPRPGAPELGERPASPKAAPAVAAAAAGGAAAAPTATTPPSSHGTPLRILYGSNGGTCEALAASLAARAAQAGFAVTQAPLDAGFDGGAAFKPDAGATVIVTSTYNGAPPDNARTFAKWLDAAPAIDPACRFAVFAVGNSQWAHTFLKFGKRVDAGLAATGAARVRPLGSADADGASLTDDFDDWASALLPELAAAAGVRASDAAPAPTAAATAAAADAGMRAKLTPLPAGTPTLSPSDVVRVFRESAGENGKDVAKGYHALAVTANTRLTPATAERATTYIELALPAGLAYVPGDHLEILPHNAAPAVDAALAALSLTGDEVFEWTPVGATAERGPARGLAAMARSLPPCPVTARDALAWLVDLAAPPSKRVVAALAERATCPPDKAALAALATDAGYKADIAGPKTAFVDVLTRFPSAAAGFTLHDFINAAPRLTPRYYSIASSPQADGGPTRVAACVGLVEYVTPAGRQHRGPGSGTVHGAAVGDKVLGTVRALQSSFKLPDDAKTPIVMIGPGTGVAPFIGFLEERAAIAAAKGAKALGPATLYFGCRGDADFIFKDRLQAWRDAGVLSSLRVAFSREPGAPKTYVQDLIDLDAAALWADLANPAARVYVCGDARRMAPDVRRAVGRVAEVAGGKTNGGAFVEAMVEEGRYLEDVWAG